MLLSCDGRRPSIPLVALVAAASLLSAGCASKTQTRTYAQMTAPSYDNLGRKPQMEDDGLPAQIAPPRRAQVEPDDPREPYSRNYGQPAPKGWTNTAALAPTRSLQPHRHPVRSEDEALIAQAILVHEQRYR
ncbi:MAG: hypothetical protein ACOYLQ_00675 [Hyphomicrobiaceae bacterium]